MRELAGKPPEGEDMEWAPVTAATGALGPVIAKLAALLGSEYKLRWRTRRDIKFIRSKLKPVYSILWNIWEREELNAASMALKMEALDLADEVDDAIVDFIPSLERSRINKQLVQTKIKASPFQDFKKRSNDVSGRCRSKWKEKEMAKNTGDDSSPAGKPRAYPFVRKDASELAFMVGPRDNLIEHLVGADEGKPVELQLKKACIYGTAGMGKTTLADLVYEAIGHKFQSRAFVSVNPGGNMREVLARILEQVAPNRSVPVAGTVEATTEEHLIDIVSNFLKDKRYLVIIDDIWNWREWEIILKSLPENNLGSRIVRTTRICYVARKWPRDDNDMLHEILPDKENVSEWRGEDGHEYIAWEMLRMKADLVGEGFDRSHPIVSMCGGTPLAVVCMFSAVAKEMEKQGEHAKTCDVQDKIEKHVMENGIQNTPGFEPLVESIQVGYDNLPHHMLKTCLLYCSIHHRIRRIKKDDMVKRWISEGFVYTEDEGNSYFEELLNRGFILPRTYYESKRIHPMMINFLVWKSNRENFITCSKEITPLSIIRRLCICTSQHKSRGAEGDNFSALDWYHIRSLIVSEGIERVPFEKLEGLRVLELYSIESLGHHLKDICGLVRLRHLLGLYNEIPPKIVRPQRLKTFEMLEDGLAPGLAGGFIQNLQQLKTLELKGPAIRELMREIGVGVLQQLHILRIKDTNIVELPKEICELQQLKILDISNTQIRELPKEIGNLQQLKTLNIRHTKIIELPKEIRKLQQLRTLNITKTHITVLPKVVGELHHLEHLLMTGTKVAKIPREIGALKELKSFKLDQSVAALPLEVCALVELPECMRQAVNKSGLVSELAQEMLSFRKSRSLGDTGGLVVGAKQICMPRWIREQFNDLVTLDIRICKLEEQGLKILREMPHLRELMLRFEVVPAEPVVISSDGFPRLEIFTIDCRVPRVTFQEGAMPELFLLTFQFRFYSGPPNLDPVGVNHLRKLWTIEFECNEDWYGGRDSPCIRPTIDVVKKEARELPSMFHFKVCGYEEEIYSPPPSPPPLLEIERSETEEEEGEEDDEEERSSGEGEIEEEKIQA